MDDWLASIGAETYTERQMKKVAERVKEEESARFALMCADSEALPAVRSGLRLTGRRWREVLLEFMAEDGEDESNREVLGELIYRGLVDPWVVGSENSIRTRI